MLLSELIKEIKINKTVGEISVEITSLCCTDREAVKGSLYFCISGTKEDGHSFAGKAISRGAAAIVCERELDVSVPQIVVENTRVAMSLFAAKFYGKPSEKLRIIGVTGTNGKTTTCHIIRNILEHAGYKTGVIGTLGIFYPGVEIAPELTTPDPIFLHRVFAEMVRAGVECVAMEVSAHAVALDKIAGIRFEVGVFTNCTRDHLDFFGTMENYAAAKAAFLTDKYCDFTVFNSDDELGRELFLKAGTRSVSYGVDGPSDVFAVNIKEGAAGTSFVMNLFDNIYNINCRMAGRFSVYNCLAAATACAVMNIDFDDIVSGIKQTEGVRGRVEMIEGRGGRIFIDYAHTPDGLKNVLLSLRKCTAGKLLCLFGCGGNRDRGKRPEMGEISGEFADYSIITSDNPRYEEPCDIIADIEEGVRRKTDKYITIQDRRSAISYAISKMSGGDVLLVAGKGAEEYQEILGVRHEFSDRRCIEEILSGESVD